MKTCTDDPTELAFREALSDRLALTVEALGRPKGEVAASIGVSQQRLSNWMTRQNYPDWYALAKLCRRYGISADWLLLGDESGLRVSLAESLARASAEKPAEAADGSRPRARRP